MTVTLEPLAEPTTEEYLHRMTEWERERLNERLGKCPITTFWRDFDPSPGAPFDERGYCRNVATHPVDVICPRCGPLARSICAFHHREAGEGRPFSHRDCGRTPVIFVWFDA
jgi:hypothetical protein